MPTRDNPKPEAKGCRPITVALTIGSSLGRLGHTIYQAIPTHPFATFASFVEDAGRISEPWLEREMGLDEQQTEEPSPYRQQE